MSFLSTLQKIFSFFNLSKGGSFDSHIKDDIRTGESYLKTKKEEQRLQKTLERDAKKVANSAKRDEKRLNKVSRETTPDEKEDLKTVWSDEEQIRKDQLLIASGDLSPEQEAALSERDAKLERESLEHIVAAEQKALHNGQKNVAKKISPVAKSIEKETRFIGSERILERAEIEDEKIETANLKKEQANDQVEHKRAA